MRKKGGEEKVGFREGGYCEVLVIPKIHRRFKKGKKERVAKVKNSKEEPNIDDNDMK